MNVSPDITKFNKNSLLKSKYFRIASVLVILIAGGLTIFKSSSSSEINLSKKNDQQTPSIHLPNGRKIILDKKSKGITLSEDNFIYSDGVFITNSHLHKEYANQIKFYPSHQEYVVVNSPNDQPYQISLPDSTKIVLNAHSTLKIPMNYYQDQNRMVELVGEAYFDVRDIPENDKQHRKRLPFAVISRGQQVEGYNTRFNIAAMPSQNQVKTTLVRGEVKVIPKNNSVFLPDLNRIGRLNVLPETRPIVLNPGQQVSNMQNKFVVNDVEVDEILAWKSDEFDGRYVPLEKLLNIFSVWYNVKVIFRDESARHITIGGTFRRNQNLKDVITMLTIVSERRIVQKGNLIIVSK